MTPLDRLRIFLLVGVALVLSMLFIIVVGGYVTDWWTRTENERFERTIAKRETLDWVTSRALAVAQGVRAGAIAVDQRDGSRIDLQMPAVGSSLGNSAVIQNFPWARLGLKHGVIRIYQYGRLSDGRLRPQMHFVAGKGIDAVFFGNPHHFGVIIVTSKRISEADRSEIGSPFTYWNDGYGIWIWPGHPFR